MPCNVSPEAIAVTGLGGLCACGNDMPSIMKGLYEKPLLQNFADVFGAYPFLQQHSSSSTVDEYPMFALRPNSPFQRGYIAEDTMALARIAAHEALADGNLRQQSGLDLAKGERLGICLGTTSGASIYFLSACKELAANGQLSPFSNKELASYFNSNLALTLGAELGAKGPVASATNACTSGADAIGMACEFLRHGWCDYMLAGGADALSYVPYIGFSKLMIYDTRPCRPFSADRNGLNLGEGAGILLLERAEHALRRKAKISGFISAYSCANDAYHTTRPHPEGRGLQRAIEGVLRQAGVEASDLAFVNAHGTGTPENDKTETLVFEKVLPNVPVWASKGVTGHTLGAAGGLEAAFTINALLQGEIPPSSGVEPGKSINNMLVCHPTPVRKAYALSVSLGFAGSNSALLFKKPE